MTAAANCDALMVKYGAPVFWRAATEGASIYWNDTLLQGCYAINKTHKNGHTPKMSTGNVVGKLKLLMQDVSVFRIYS